MYREFMCARKWRNYTTLVRNGSTLVRNQQENIWTRLPGAINTAAVTSLALSW